MFTIILNAVKENKLFSNVRKSDISFKVTPDKLLNRKKGEKVYCEGDTGNFIFLIVSGEVVIIKKSFMGKETRETRQTNDFFGEEDFLEEMPRMSMAVASEDTRLLVLDKAEIEYFINSFEPVLSNLKRLPPEEPAKPETEMIQQESSEEGILKDFQEDFNPGEAKPLQFKETRDFSKAQEFGKIQEFGKSQGSNGSDDLFSSRGKIPDSFTSFIKDELLKDGSSGDTIKNEAAPDDEEVSFRFEDEELRNSGREDFNNESFDKESVKAGGPADWENPVPRNDLNFDDIYGANPVKDLEATFNSGFGGAIEEDKILFEVPKSDFHLPGESNTGEDVNLSDITLDDIPSGELSTSLHASGDSEKELTGEQLRHIIQAAHIVNSNIKIDDVLNSIVEAAKNLTEAERGTLYIVDRDKGELWSKVINGKGITEIRLKIGEGIAGWVAENKQTVNIKDAKSDPRFASRIDHMSGYETRNMICFPIVNKSDEVIGVLQLLNGRPGKFTELDEQFLSALSIHAALALENAELVEKLLQTERITSLGKMANFLIQDIKKPVLVSKRYAEHLKTKQLTPDVNQVVDMLLEQLNHVADLVQTTSSYSEGKTVLHSVICKLNETLEEVLAKLQSNVILRKCEIVKQYDKDVTVKLDRKEFYQCCFHIIRNACDAMPDGGRIFITSKIEKNSVEISFRDTGLGIPDSIKDKIFEPFMSHGKKEGTGLGLSITKKIVEDHGGTINVESDLGEGATFTISLPIASVR